VGSLLLLLLLVVVAVLSARDALPKHGGEQRQGEDVVAVKGGSVSGETDGNKWNALR